MEATALKLLEEGASLLAPLTEHGRSPLMMAAHAGRLDLAASIAQSAGDALHIAEIRELMALGVKHREVEASLATTAAAPPKWYRAWREGNKQTGMNGVVIAALEAAKSVTERECGELLELAVHDGLGDVVAALVKRGAKVDGRALHKVILHASTYSTDFVRSYCLAGHRVSP